VEQLSPTVLQCSMAAAMVLLESSRLRRVARRMHLALRGLVDAPFLPYGLRGAGGRQRRRTYTLCSLPRWHELHGEDGDEAAEEDVAQEDFRHHRQLADPVAGRLVAEAEVWDYPQRTVKWVILKVESPQNGVCGSVRRLRLSLCPRALARCPASANPAVPLRRSRCRTAPRNGRSRVPLAAQRTERK